MLQRTLIFLDGVIVFYFLFEMFLKVRCSLSYVTNTLFCDWVRESEREGEREWEKERKGERERERGRERDGHVGYNSTFPLQVIALGLILHRGSYLRSFFNILDSFVVISSLIPILYYITRTPPTTDRYCLYAIKIQSMQILLHTIFAIRSHWQ